MKIMGVDPGLVRTGYGLIESNPSGRIKLIELGVIKTSSRDKISKRTFVIYQNLANLVSKHRPDAIVLEKLYSHYKHPTTSILMGHARGIVCLVCGINNIDLVNYSATHVKKAITGNGMAAKYQVQGMVKAILGLEKAPEPFDASDALAMAISYAYVKTKEYDFANIRPS